MDATGRASGPYEARQIVVEARSQAAAEEAASLILAAMAAIDGGEFTLDRDLLTSTQPDDMQKEGRARVPVGCEIARRTARKNSYNYALAKLWLSYHTASTPLVDLLPDATGETASKSSNAFDQTRMAYAIVLANAVVEELGLDLRASAAKPSTVSGQWNQVVLADLELRLRGAHVDLTDPYLWTVRGPRTMLEADRPRRNPTLAPWAAWPDVRDADVQIADAIAHVEWLRDRVTAHKTSPGYWQVLSIYDVQNAQALARRLLLSALRMWPLPIDY